MRETGTQTGETGREQSEKAKCRVSCKKKPPENKQQQQTSSNFSLFLFLSLLLLLLLLPFAPILVVQPVQLELVQPVVLGLKLLELDLVLCERRAVHQHLLEF